MSSPSCSSACLFADSQPTAVCKEWSLTDKLWVAPGFDFWQVIRDKTDDRQQSKIISEQNVPEWSDYFAKWILTSEEVEEGRESLRLINIISLLARERKWWRTDIPLRNPAAPRAQTVTQRYRTDYFPSKLTKQEKATVGLFFFVIHGEKKQNKRLATADVKIISPLRSVSCPLAEPWHRKQDGGFVCWINQIFSEGQDAVHGALERLLVHHQILHPQLACKVNTQVGLALFPASVTLQCQHSGLYMRGLSDRQRLRG